MVSGNKKPILIRVSTPKKTLAVAVVWALAVATLASAAALACDCRRPSTPAAEFAGADAVFRGVMLRRVAPPVGVSLETYVFRASTVYKGDLAGEISLSGYLSECTFFFKPGREYLVYAYRGRVEDRDMLNTGICQRTREIGAADEDLRFLDSREPP